MCEKIQSEFVEKMNDVDLKQCKALYQSSKNFKAWEENTNRWLSTWGWSHLSVYSPKETDEIWSSKSKSIGVKIKNYNGKYLVSRAHENSKFKKGDLFLRVNGKKKPTYNDIMYSGGEYLISRLGEKMLINEKVEEHIWSDGVELVGDLLIIPSFRGEFFEDKKLNELKNKIKKIKSKTLHVDLRQNFGGNVAAGLKFLSLFFCKATIVGEFKIPSKKGLGVSDYPLTTSQSYQVEYKRGFEKVKSSRKLALKKD